MAKFWGSRFKKGTDKLADQFSFSIDYDHRLAKYDCLAGIAHAQMLGDKKIIPTADAKKIVSGLKRIIKTIDTATFKFNPEEEDIHSNIQSLLKKDIGAPADRLHTARSRNDLIVTDMKLYCAVEEFKLIGSLTGLQAALVKTASKYMDVIIPAYTHLQNAQVVLFAHHMLAFVEMIARDKTRLSDAVKRMDELPLGCCALSGTTLPINRKSVAKALGFTKPSANSIDSVSDRDFVIETLSNLAIIGTHYSRMCEDLIIWATSEFNFIDIDWSMCTGSSIMPHKKNPDICELIRGESATLISNLNQVLILVKGLPLTYNRDLQLDKPPLFESMEKVQMITELLKKLFGSLKVKKDVLKKCVTDEHFFSIDIMEYLIRKDVAYRDAHDATGKLIKDCLDKGNKLSDLDIKNWKKFNTKFEHDVKKLLNPQTSVKMKKSFGSTNPKFVAQQLQEWKKMLHA